jgi:ATP-binding cassette subfamily B (MDR/TAP) protein 1
VQAANYYFWLSQLEPTVQETESNKDLGPKYGCSSYDFKDIQFTYPLAPDNRVLKGVSLQVCYTLYITSGLKISDESY